MRLTLHVNGLGHVPSFKNSKMIARGRLITDPKKQKWMEECIQSFVSQLRSECQIIAEGTQTAWSPRSWIASSMPEDDCWQNMPILTVRTELDRKGWEGATIEIEHD